MDEALTGATKALVLTDGLLMYLEDLDVEALSAAFKRPELAWWLFDVLSPDRCRWMTKKSANMLEIAPFKSSSTSMANPSTSFRSLARISRGANTGAAQS